MEKGRKDQGKVYVAAITAMSSGGPTTVLEKYTIEQLNLEIRHQINLLLNAYMYKMTNSKYIHQKKR